MLGQNRHPFPAPTALRHRRRPIDNRILRGNRRTLTFTGTIIIYETPAGALHHAFSPTRPSSPSAIEVQHLTTIIPSPSPLTTPHSPHARTGPPPSNLPGQEAMSDILRPNPRGTPPERHRRRPPTGSQGLRASEASSTPKHRYVPRLSGVLRREAHRPLLCAVPDYIDAGGQPRESGEETPEIRPSEGKGLQRRVGWGRTWCQASPWVGMGSQ